LARVKHIDSVLVDELRAGLEQLVILGAGFDTRAYRFAEQLVPVRVFEVDHPVTAALKKERVIRALGGLPEHVTYLAVDLEHQELGPALASAGYDPQLRTLFIWSGVSFYLSADAVGEVFAFVRASSPPDSSLVFDYHYQGFTDGSRDYYGSAQAKRRVEELGEPCIFGIDEGAVAALLERHGLELVSDFGPAELERRYLVGGDGRVAGHPFGSTASPTRACRSSPTGLTRPLASPPPPTGSPSPISKASTQTNRRLQAATSPELPGGARRAMKSPRCRRHAPVPKQTRNGPAA
jgi:methyltransferase (TIGR00027 family)